MKMDILCRKLSLWLLGSLKVQLNILATLVLLLGVVLSGASLPVRAASAPAKAIVYPIDVIASRGWYITLPTKIHATPDTVEVGGSPDLMTYADEWFRLNNSKDGAVFKVRTDGAHTENSNNPRSELREMSSDGKTQAAWSSTSGTHSMEIEETVNVLPIGSKPVVVVGQIHDVGSDVSVFRLEGNTSGDRNIGSLWITDGDTTHGYLLTSSYRLGTKFRVGFNVSGRQITYTYNGQPVAGYSQSKSFSGAYFKAGSYNQSGGNCTKLPSGPDAGKCDYAEVTIYNVQVCHSGTCTGNAPGSTNPIPTSTPGSPSATPTTVAPINTPSATATASPTPINTPSATATLLPPPPPEAGSIIYVSTTQNGKIDNLSFKDEDILTFDTSTQRWQMYFDGSDVGLSSADVDAFAILNDGSLLFSFIARTKVPGLDNVDDSDIVRFMPQSLGAQTEGDFEVYFDGSDVGLTTDSEDIDALAVTADGSLIISTRSSYSVPDLTGDDTDLLKFTPQHLGDGTQGTWSRYFKGSDQGFKPKSGEDISGVSLDELNPSAIGLYLTTLGDYEVNGLSGDNNDIFGCTLTTTNPCTFNLFWDGDAHNLTGKAIDAMQVRNNLTNQNLVSAASIVEADDGGVDDVESVEEQAASDSEPESGLTNRIFLPIIVR